MKKVLVCAVFFISTVIFSGENKSIEALDALAGGGNFELSISTFQHQGKIFEEISVEADFDRSLEEMAAAAKCKDFLVNNRYGSFLRDKEPLAIGHKTIVFTVFHITVQGGQTGAIRGERIIKKIKDSGYHCATLKELLVFIEKAQQVLPGQISISALGTKLKSENMVGFLYYNVMDKGKAVGFQFSGDMFLAKDDNFLAVKD